MAELRLLRSRLAEVAPYVCNWDEQRAEVEPQDVEAFKKQTLDAAVQAPLTKVFSKNSTTTIPHLTEAVVA